MFLFSLWHCVIYEGKFQVFITSLFLLVKGSPSIELELSFKTTLDQYELAYSSASFTISDDIIYVVNGANVGNAILKFDLNGEYLEEYPGWYNFPHDILIGVRASEYHILFKIFSYIHATHVASLVIL